MATKTTQTGQSVEQYIRDMLAQAQKAGSAAIEAGYPAESALTKAYYAGIPSLYMYGDPEQKQALERAASLYGAYGAAGGYEKTPFADIGEAYRAAGVYGPADFEMADYTAKNIEFLQLIYQAVIELLDMFESEGNGFIAQGLIKEAEEECLPAIELSKMSRYLYQIWP